MALPRLGIFYDYRVCAHLTAGCDLYGTIETKQYLRESNISVSVDHVACIPYLGSSGAFDLAIRWTLTAGHTGKSNVLGEASQAPFLSLPAVTFAIC